MGVAFLLAFLMRDSRWSYLLPYVDPALVALLVAVMIRDPIKIVVEGVGELLAVSPEETVQKQIQEKFARAVKGYPVRSFNLRMLKAGRTHYLLAHVVVEPDSRIDDIREQDALRKQITSGLKMLQPPWEVDVVFVADESLA